MDQRLNSANSLGAGIMPNHNAYAHIPHGQGQYNTQESNYTQLMNSQIANAQLMDAQQQNGQTQFKTTNGQNGLHSQMDSLATAFGGISLQGLGNVNAGKVVNNGMSTNFGVVPAVTCGQSNGTWYYQNPDGRIFVSGVSGSLGNYQQSAGPFSVTPAQAQYLQQASYHVGQTLPNMTQTHTWNGAQQFPRDLPELSAARRNSFSSNEENGPHTPFFAAQSRIGSYQPRVSITGNSPQTWTTPSPEQLGQPFYPQPLAKTPDGQYTFCDLDALCQQDPPIPSPVPAIFSGEKARGTLEKSLHNILDTTNVYIRGLRPDTTDEMLHAYGARFGDIVSAKSMLDQHTGLCKGFGFIKYHNFIDGENCIRGFFHWGYEAKWARISHNEKLKTLGDNENTNLYVANLPLTFNEATLKAIFINYDCISAKILRDQNGLSRGVGFARFATPEICDQIIQTYNGKSIGNEGHVLSIRYSDTEKQKQLKNETAERRQFKTNEYNASVFGIGSPYVASPVTATFPSPLQPRVVSQAGFWPAQTAISPLYSTYAQAGGAFPTQMGPPLSNFLPKTESMIVNTGRYNSRIKIESPSVAALAKRTNQECCDSSPSTIAGDDVTCIKIDAGLEPGQACKVDTKSSPSKSSITRSSPTKSATAHTPSKL
ncbi:hypothetical protein MMC27_002707 [Xylographa pallens]|nr:hypothetical protein [Xylographa pallens]